MKEIEVKQKEGEDINEKIINDKQTKEVHGNSIPSTSSFIC